MKSSRRAVLFALPMLAWAMSATAQAPPSRLRGTIAARDGDTLTFATRPGETVKVALPANVAVVAVVPKNLDDIKKDSFIGTAAVPGPSGALMALEIHIFPESMRGTGEGHRPFDLQPESTMTNGTVGDVTVANGHTLTVGYKGGQQTVIVPPDTPIVGFEPGDRALLTVGAHAILFGAKQADGSFVPARILVGKDGLVPPM
jgi:endonuclease YncB( thermonuclease family)